MIRIVYMGISLGLLFLAQACKPKPNESSLPASQMTDKKAMKDTLPPPSPEEALRKEKSIALLEELQTALEKRVDCKNFAALVSRLKGKDIFHHVENQGYRILIPTDLAYKKIPKREADLLKSEDPGLQGYQMSFFIHHVCPEPNNPYPGYAYRSLSGKDYVFQKDSLVIKDVPKEVGMKESGYSGSKLHLYLLSEALFY